MQIRHGTAVAPESSRTDTARHMRYPLIIALLLCLQQTIPSIKGQVNKPASSGVHYRLLNNTGQFDNSECFWSLDHGRSWHSFQESSTPSCPPGNGRLYFALGRKPQNFDDRSSAWDFIEYATGPNQSWHGNTTQVDAFRIPITIEMGDRKAGINKPVKVIHQLYRETAPAEFQACLKNDWILSPCRAGFDTHGPNAKYFDNYINEVWSMYATERKTPSGKWIGKVVGTALQFRPADGQGETLVCPQKPSTQDAFLGTGVLAQNPRFCAAINRHVLADPADWNRPEKFYQQAPFNFYSKFMHQIALNGKAYGFCYDDVADQSSFFSAQGPEVVITLYFGTK